MADDDYEEYEEDADDVDAVRWPHARVLARLGTRRVCLSARARGCGIKSTHAPLLRTASISLAVYMQLKAAEEATAKEAERLQKGSAEVRRL